MGSMDWWQQLPQIPNGRG
uniref:Uncharacterized protein n=1 Tax=Arundo donax TaxID=35708 RepID=A0A0A9C8H1_ARUDO